MNEDISGSGSVITRIYLETEIKRKPVNARVEGVFLYFVYELFVILIPEVWLVKCPTMQNFLELSLVMLFESNILNP